MGNTFRTMQAVNRRVRRHGWTIARWPAGHPGYRRHLMLLDRRVDLVLDVGANAGFYTQELREFGYQGQVLSFEPLSTAFERLRSAATHDPAWDIVRSGVGAEAGQLTLNISGNSVSSSMLPMLARHADSAPESRFIGTEIVPIEPLDVLAKEAIANAEHPFLKVDTQGYEVAVLDGATETLAQVIGVELEMSMVPLYEGQILMPETIDRMESAGFRLAGLNSGFWDRTTGETLQVDGTFLRL